MHNYTRFRCIQGTVCDLKTNCYHDGSGDNQDLFPTYESGFGLTELPGVILTFKSKRRLVFENGSTVVVAGQFEQERVKTTVNGLRTFKLKPRFICYGDKNLASRKERIATIIPNPLHILLGLIFFLRGVYLLLGIFLAIKKLTNGKWFSKISYGELSWGRILYAALVGPLWDTEFKSTRAK